VAVKVTSVPTSEGLGLATKVTDGAAAWLAKVAV